MHPLGEPAEQLAGLEAARPAEDRARPDGFGREETCPLCGTAALRDRALAFGRRFRECPRCHLLSMHPADHPSPEDEARRYRLHRNDPEDPGYRAFLRRLLDPALEHLRPGARGLDYGCGPEPLLASMARADGLTCDSFDPHFHPHPPAPPYDFVLASEVFEHFREPGAEIARVTALLVSADPHHAGISPRSRDPRDGGGLLAVMTLHWRDDEDLSRWHYLSDPTHVSVYRAETFAWIAADCGLVVEWADGERVVLLRRTGCSSPRPPLR